jgi:hypothetical protein
MQTASLSRIVVAKQAKRVAPRLANQKPSQLSTKCGPESRQQFKSSSNSDVSSGKKNVSKQSNPAH